MIKFLKTWARKRFFASNYKLPDPINPGINIEKFNWVPEQTRISKLGKTVFLTITYKGTVK